MPADKAAILTEVQSMVRSVLGEFGPDVEVTTTSSFSDDLEMESIDVVALAGRLQARYGDVVNFAQFVSRLDVSSMAELRVGQVVDYIAESLDQAPSSSVVAS